MEEIVTEIMKRMSDTWIQFKKDHDCKNFANNLFLIGDDYSEGVAHTFYTCLMFAFTTAANEVKRNEK